MRNNIIISMRFLLRRNDKMRVKSIAFAWGITSLCYYFLLEFSELRLQRHPLFSFFKKTKI